VAADREAHWRESRIVMQQLELTDEQKLIQETVRRIADEHFKPGAASADKNYTPPIANLKVLAANGFTGIFIPQTYGGSGLGVLEMTLVVEQVARACANTGILLSCTDGATPRTILHAGTEAMKRKYLPKFAKGELYAAWSMSEPSAGSDVGNVQTRATLDGNHYVINGAKLWCSCAQVADLFLVLVRFNAEPGMRGVGAILVDRDAPGFSIGKHLDLIGLRATGMAELFFEDCRVPAENVIVPAGGMRKLLAILDQDRIAGNPPICLGAAQAAFTDVVQHVRDRKQFGRALAENQGLQWMLADMAIDLEASRALLYRAATRCDDGTMTAMDASIAKTYVNEAAIRITSSAMQLAGASGLSQEFPYERYYRDVRGMAIGYGTTEIHRNSIAREILDGRYTV
jgi:alkylation response protein AidB-like acyl-CoA dehydrogenase